ncbi:hypothetical protein PQX77_006864 [Marasmius sp. AFHP31]|nr:hypothetical protein PQX77_006864 [Marasmius sp. AFHP31]
MKLPEYEKHPKYSFEDANVAFIVEDRVKFDIHRHFLRRDSKFFCSILAAQSSHPDGAYRVPGLKIQEFESLLDFFYDGMYRVSPTDTPIDSWVNILSIATVMEFPRAREHAITAIDIHQRQSNSNGLLTPARMIQIANTYGVEKWLEPAYEALAERDEIIDEEEADMIGMKGVLVIMKARETRLRDQIRQVRMSRGDVLQNKTIVEEVKESSPQTPPLAPSLPSSLDLSTAEAVEYGSLPGRSTNIFDWVPANVEDLDAKEAKPENQQLDDEDEAVAFCAPAVPDNTSLPWPTEEVVSLYPSESSSEIEPIGSEHDVVHGPMRPEQVSSTDVGPSVSGEDDPLAQEVSGVHWTEVEVNNTILVYNNLKDEIKDWRPLKVKKGQSKVKGRERRNIEKRQRLRDIEEQVERLNTEFSKYLTVKSDGDVYHSEASDILQRTQEELRLLIESKKTAFGMVGASSPSQPLRTAPGVSE